MAPLCLTKEDCNSLLANFSGCELSKYSLEPFNKETRGFLGEHLLLKLNVKSGNENRELSFFVKTLLQCEGLSDVFDDGDFFEKELFVYNFVQLAGQLIPDIPRQCMPTMYYHTSDETLVLENLKQIGYTGCSSHKFDKDHMLRAIASLAKFHAISFAFEEFRSKELKHKYYLADDYAKYFDGFFVDNAKSSGYQFIQSALYGALTLVDLVYGDDNVLKRKLIDYRQTFFDVLNKPNKKYRKVLCHGDLWGNNMVFKYENSIPIDCKLVDFQMIRYLPPAHDVTMLLYQASPKDLYQKHIHEYYDFYYRSLTEELENLKIDIKDVYPLEEYEETCKVYMPSNKYLWLCYRQSTDAKTGYSVGPETDKDQLRSKLLGKEARIQFVKDNFINDLYYKNTLSEILEDNRLTFNNEIVSLEDCFKAITSKIDSQEYTLKDWQLEKFESRTGILGEHYFLTATIVHGGIEKDLRFFAKLSSQSEKQMEFILSSGMAYKEMQFFNRIIPDFNAAGIYCLQAVVPRCHLAKLDILILENLKENGYKIEPIRNGIGLETLKCTISALARLHASGIIFEERLSEKLGRCARLNELYPREFKEAFYNRTESSINIRKACVKGMRYAINVFSNHTSTITPDTFLKTIEELLFSFEDLVIPSKKYRNTICHGDIWCNNILIKDKSKGCVFVDFQSYRYTPPALDFMHYLYFSTTSDVRSLHMQHLLDFYYAELKSVIESHSCDMESILTYEEFLECCEQNKPSALLQAASYFHNITLPLESFEELLANEEYFNKSMYVDRSEHIKISCENDAIFKGFIKDTISELRDLCENLASKK